MDRESLEQMLAAGLTLGDIGRQLDRHPSTVGYWVAKHGLRAPNRERHAPRGGIDRDVLESLVETGSTIAEIGTSVGMSKATVRHWLAKYGLNTKNGTGRRMRAEVRRALADGQRSVTLTCEHHGETEFRLEGRGAFRCCRCRAAAVARRRRKVKAILVREAGGCCAICGYGENPHALHFHHRDPAEKEFALGSKGVTRSLERARAEAAKCVLLCANCHADVEARVARVP